jgi:hypothetical protein
MHLDRQQEKEMTKTGIFPSLDGDKMGRASKYGFQTEQERERDRSSGEAEASARQANRKQILEATVQKIGPVIRDCLVEFFRGMHLSTVDFTGEEQVALFKEEPGSKHHSWKASSWKKTGTHTEYRADGAHLLDEHTAYTITVILLVNPDNVPLLHMGEYTASKLVGKIPTIASSFSMEVPSQLKDRLGDKTGIRLADNAEYLWVQDH